MGGVDPARDPAPEWSGGLGSPVTYTAFVWMRWVGSQAEVAHVKCHLWDRKGHSGLGSVLLTLPSGQLPASGPPAVFRVRPHPPAHLLRIGGTQADAQALREGAELDTAALGFVGCQHWSQETRSDTEGLLGLGKWPHLL